MVKGVHHCSRVGFPPNSFTLDLYQAPILTLRGKINRPIDLTKRLP